jgi:hypothetical protein
MKEKEGYLLPSLERLEASVEEDKTVGAECGDALVMKGLSLSIPVPTLTVYTDASNLGWGAYLEGSWAL